MTFKKSKQLFQQAQRVLVGGVNSPVRAFRAVGGTPVFMARGRGARLWDVDGRSYVDYVGSWGPLIWGHAPSFVARAAHRALRNGSTFGAPTELEVRTASLVRSAFPHMERVRFTSSGTEACLSALRLARGFTGRQLIVKFAGCYHGHADGLLVEAGSGALTLGHPSSAGVPPAVARLTLVLPFNDAAAARAAFQKWGKSIAAVILEPVVGNMGVVPAHPDFLKVLRGLTRAQGALLIFDEVMTGFRLAFGGAQALYGVTPDITTLGKIIGGGFPVGALGGPRRIMEKLAPLGPVYQAGTLSGNPVAMAAGEAALSALKSRPPYKRLASLTQDLAEGFQQLAARAGRSVSVQSVESMFTVFFTRRPVTNLSEAMTADAKAYARFFHGLLKRGVYFPPSQFEAAFLSAAHTPADIEKTLRAAHGALRDI